MVAEPVFFPRHLWVREPQGFSRNIVAGRREDLLRGDGARLLADCLRAAAVVRATTEPAGEAAQPTLPLAAQPTVHPGGYGAGVVRRPRIGQGTFKGMLLGSYGGACAASREHSLPVLDAAHIRPFSEVQHHDVRNGLLLRTDVHRLFDQGYVTVTPDYAFKVSPRLQADFGNGKLYRSYEGKIQVPSNPAHRPDRDALAWHGETRFLR